MIIFLFIDFGKLSYASGNRDSEAGSLFSGWAKLRDDRDEKFDKLRMTPKTFDKMKNLHKNTYYTAVKAIIGKMGSILYKELPKRKCFSFFSCFN